MSTLGEKLRELESAVGVLQQHPEMKHELAYVQQRLADIRTQCFRSAVDVINEAIDEVSRQRGLLCERRDDG